LHEIIEISTQPFSAAAQNKPNRSDVFVTATLFAVAGRPMRRGRVPRERAIAE
jgi:hypothetical protein